MAVKVDYRWGGGEGGGQVAHPNDRKMVGPSLHITYHRKRQRTDVLIYTVRSTLYEEPFCSQNLSCKEIKILLAIVKHSL
jgi:hypothetical protein